METGRLLERPRAGEFVAQHLVDEWIKRVGVEHVGEHLEPSHGVGHFVFVIVEREGRGFFVRAVEGDGLLEAVDEAFFVAHVAREHRRVECEPTPHRGIEHARAFAPE